jgi:hypothetical protein
MKKTKEDVKVLISGYGDVLDPGKGGSG